jgi:hypothetical protein
MFNVGDIVKYKGRKYYLYSIYSNNERGILCHIVIIRNGSYKHTKKFKQGNYEWYEEYLNASIANVKIDEIEKE